MLTIMQRIGCDYFGAVAAAVRFASLCVYTLGHHFPLPHTACHVFYLYPTPTSAPSSFSPAYGPLSFTISFILCFVITKCINTKECVT